jgi:hypothetical protein
MRSLLDSKSICRKEAQKAQKSPFLFASLALFCGKKFFPFCIEIDALR